MYSFDDSCIETVDQLTMNFKDQRKNRFEKRLTINQMQIFKSNAFRTSNTC